MRYLGKAYALTPSNSIHYGILLIKPRVTTRYRQVLLK